MVEAAGIEPASAKFPSLGLHAYPVFIVTSSSPAGRRCYGQAYIFLTSRLQASQGAVLCNDLQDGRTGTYRWRTSRG